MRLLKMTILAAMDRDTLKTVLDVLELEGVDRRSVDAMVAKLSRSRSVTPEVLLPFLGEGAVKAVCESMGVPRRGRKAGLIQRLLSADLIAVPKKGTNEETRMVRRYEPEARPSGRDTMLEQQEAQT